MQVFKALLQSDLLKHFKTMTHELAKLELQQYPGQNITHMSLDVTYHCQALTTDGIWDHQLCSSILSTFLLAYGDEMYCHALITRKATMEHKLCRKTSTHDWVDLLPPEIKMLLLALVFSFLKSCLFKCIFHSL